MTSYALQSYWQLLSFGVAMLLGKYYIIKYITHVRMEETNKIVANVLNISYI